MFGGGHRRGWRGAIGLIAAYALVLQAFLAYSIAVPATAHEHEIGPVHGTPACIGLRNRRGGAEDQDLHAASIVTRRQKSDMIAGSRAASNFRQAGYPARNASPDMVASFAG